MSEIRELLRRAAEGYELPADLPERARRRAARLRRRRRMTAAFVAISLSVATIVGLSTAFRGSFVVPAGTCPRSWAVVQPPELSGPGGLSSVAVLAPDDAWAVGPGEEAMNEMSINESSPLAAHWTGTRWRSVSPPAPAVAGTSELVAVDAASPDDLWAVGDADSGELNSEGGAIVHVLVEHWDGSAWSIVKAPDLSPSAENRLLDVAVAGPNDAWAVGFGSQGNLAVPLIERWDGSSWRIVSNPDVTGPNGGAVLNAVAVAGPEDVWAVGDAGGGTLIEHWNGKSWQVVSSPSVGSFPDESSVLRSVAALSADDVWAVGNHFSSGGPSSSGGSVSVVPVSTLVEHWDGTSWTIVDSADVPDQSNYLTSVAAAGPDDVWAVGGHRPTGDVRGSETATLIEHWDGSSWRIVPSPDQAQRAELLGVAALSSGEVWMVGAAAASQTGQGELQGVKPLIESGDCS